MANRASFHRRAIATSCVLGLALAAACGGGQKGPVSPIGAPGSSSAAPLPPAVPADATPIHIEFAAGGCSVVVDDSPGGSYLAPSGREARAAEALAPTLKACFTSGAGRHGLLHVRSAVGANGALSDTMAAPGGALSNEVETCISKAMGQVTLPAPRGGTASLLLLVTSTCPEH